MSLHFLHLFLVATWGGLVLAEVVVELLARTTGARRYTAAAHFWMDALFELPLLAGIIVTGGILLARTWPPSTLLLVKLGAAVIALACNLTCAVLVVQRRNATDDDAVARLTTRIRYTGVGVPFGLVALAVGLARFHAP